MGSILRQEKSTFQGRLVCISREQGDYFGAQPYYRVAYHKRRGGIQVVRYTPFADRAHALFLAMCRDVLEPAALARLSGPLQTMRNRQPA